jgi:hypothetical protein
MSDINTVERYVDKAAFFEKIGYKPHPEQMKYHNSKARFKAPVCGRRFGKSTMAARDLEPELFVAKRRYWIVGPTYDLGEKEFRILWDDLIIGGKLGHDKKVKRAYNKKQGDMYIEFPWQTRVEVRSADHPENLVGEALHGVIMSEAAKHRSDTWERYVRAALADHRGWATFPTTPEGQNWLYQLWRFGRNPEFPDYESWRFPSWANRVLYPGGRQDPEILLIEKTTTPEWFEQEIAADFTAFVGKIYGEFTEDGHVDRVPYNPALPNYMAFDFGYVNPLAAVEFQVTADDRIQVWREHYKSYTTLPEHLQLMSQRDQPPGYKIDLAFGDAADPEAAAYISTHLVPCVADPAAKKNWREGVDLVKTFLKPRETGLYDEYDRPLYKPGLVIDHSCDNIIREFGNYRSPNTQRSGNNPKNPRETSQGVDDHALDALRYGLMSIFKLGAGAHLEDVIETSGRTGTVSQLESGIFTSAGMSF